MGPGLCGPTDRRCPPDPQMALARLPSLARGRESCRASHPPKHGRPVRIHASWRTESPRRRFRRDDQVSPVPPPRPTRRPPRPPGWLATAGMQHTNKTPMPHSPGRHQGDDGDLKKRPASNLDGLKTLNGNRRSPPRRASETTSHNELGGAAGPPPWSLQMRPESASRGQGWV